MRKIILATAALVGLAGPALADMTLPVGDYSQAQSSGWTATETAPAAFSAMAPTHFSTGHWKRGHVRTHHSLEK